MSPDAAAAALTRTSRTALLPAGRTNSTHTVVLVIVVAALARAALAASVGLSVDESYTVAIARQQALSYFDHPPLHIWLVGLWGWLLGREDPLLLRFPFIALFAGSTWLMYRLTALAFGERAGLWAALALNLTPLFTVGIASWVLPDGPLVFFSLLGVWAFIRYVQAARPRTSEPIGWLIVGAAAGLALLSKYLAIFPVGALGLYLLTSRHRRLLTTPAPWLAALLALLLFSPVLAWNAAHGWVSFAFQAGRARPARFDLVRLALDLAGQLAYLMPWIGAGLAFALVRALKNGPRHETRWLFACLAAGPIAFFSLAAPWAKVLPHWPAIGWLFAFPLLGEWLACLERQGSTAPRRVAAATACTLLLLLATTASQATTGWADRFVPGFPAHDPTVDVLDWRDLETAIAARGLLQPGMVGVALSWVDAGKLDYALRAKVPVLCLSLEPHGFAFLNAASAYRGHTALIVTNAERTDWRRLAAPYFERVQPLGKVILRRNGRPALVLKIARGIDLRVPLKRRSER